MRILVTGGAGFIGAAFTRAILESNRHEAVVLDKLTYAADPDALEELAAFPGYAFRRADICDGAAVAETLARYRPHAVAHLAAETHVDRSIDAAAEFIRTNVVGTQILLDAVLDHWHQLDDADKRDFRFLHVSTDEVYGSLGDTGIFTEDSPYNPNSPYAASKAAADHLVRAWHRTYGLPVVVSHCSNNYGPRQFPEKLVPLMIIAAIEGKPLPIYGRGANVRDWVHVTDCAQALLATLEKGRVGETYDVGGGGEHRNLEVVRMICTAVDETASNSPHHPHGDLIRFVEDRPGHDWRYAVDGSKVRRELGWSPRIAFAEGIRETVLWYLANQPWWERIRTNVYAGERLGRDPLLTRLKG